MRWLWVALMGRLGVKVRVFHLGDYRRQVLGTKGLPEDYFWAKATDETMQLRQQIMDTCRSDLLNFFDVEKGQVLRPLPLSLRSAPLPFLLQFPLPRPTCSLLVPVL
jgi:hypothetical protein